MPDKADMGTNLSQLCREECLRLLRELPRHKSPRILLHTLKANVHALGLTQLAREIHKSEEGQLKVCDLPLAKWQKEIERLGPVAKSWQELLSAVASEKQRTLSLEWHGPQLDELTSIILHLARNTVAHGNRDHLKMWVTVKQRGQQWHVQIRDDGGGMEKHERTADLLAGRAQGLSSVRETLKSWGGTCGILSNPGQGVIVTLQFPISAAHLTKKVA